MKAHIINSDLSSRLPGELAKFNERDLRWLWYFMTPDPLSQEADIFNQCAQSPTSRLDYIHSKISNTSNDPDGTNPAIKHIIQGHRHFVLNLNHFDWIPEKNLRLIDWCQTQLSRKLSSSLQTCSDSFVTSNPKEDFIYRIDTWNTHREEKAEFLQALKIEWPNAQIKPHQYKWLDSKNLQQLEWAIEYLKKMAPQQRGAYYSDQEKHSYIISRLDGLSSWHPAEKELFIQKMKKSWNQKKFRDQNRHLKSINLRLNKDVVKKLDEMAGQRNQTRHEFISFVIKNMNT